MCDVKNLTKEEAFELFEIIGIERLRKILDGVVSAQINDSKLYETVYRRINEKKIRNIIKKEVGDMITQVHTQTAKYKRIYLNEYKSLFQAIYESIFKNHVRLFFKISEQLYSTNEYINIIQSIMLLIPELCNEGNSVIVEEQETSANDYSQSIIDIGKLKESEIFDLVDIIGISVIQEQLKRMNYVRYTNEYNKNFIPNYVWQKRNERPVKKMLKELTDNMLLKIDENLKKYEEMYESVGKAFLQAMFESPFCDNIKLYFTLKGKKCSEDYLSLLQFIMTATDIDFNCDDSSSDDSKSENLDTAIDVNQLNILKLKIDELKKENDAKNERLILLQKEKAALEDDLKRVQEDKNKENETLSSVIEAQNKLSEIHSQIELGEKQYSELRGNIDILKQQIEKLSIEASDWETEAKQIEKKKQQLAKGLDEEIKSFSDNFVHSTAVTALIKQASFNCDGISEKDKIFVEISELIKDEKKTLSDIEVVTDILKHNLSVAGIEKNVEEWAKILISIISAKANIMLYCNNSGSIADALSMSVYGEAAAHIVLPIDTSDIPYFIRRINNIERSIIYIDNGFDALSDRLCISLTKYCKEKIFVFGVNGKECLNFMTNSLLLSNTVYINLLGIQGYLINEDYKVACWDKYEVECKVNDIKKIYSKKILQEAISVFGIPVFNAQLLAKITCVYSFLYKIEKRKIITTELLLSFLIGDMVSLEELEKFKEIIEEDDDDKYDMLQKMLGEE